MLGCLLHWIAWVSCLWQLIILLSSSLQRLYNNLCCASKISRSERRQGRKGCRRRRSSGRDTCWKCGRRTCSWRRRARRRQNDTSRSCSRRDSCRRCRTTSRSTTGTRSTTSTRNWPASPNTSTFPKQVLADNHIFTNLLLYLFCSAAFFSLSSCRFNFSGLLLRSSSSSLCFFSSFFQLSSSCRRCCLSQFSISKMISLSLTATLRLLPERRKAAKRSTSCSKALLMASSCSQSYSRESCTSLRVKGESMMLFWSVMKIYSMLLDSCSKASREGSSTQSTVSQFSAKTTYYSESPSRENLLPRLVRSALLWQTLLWRLLRTRENTMGWVLSTGRSQMTWSLAGQSSWTERRERRSWRLMRRCLTCRKEQLALPEAKKTNSFLLSSEKKAVLWVGEVPRWANWLSRKGRRGDNHLTSRFWFSLQPNRYCNTLTSTSITMATSKGCWCRRSLRRSSAGGRLIRQRYGMFIIYPAITAAYKLYCLHQMSDNLMEFDQIGQNIVNNFNDLFNISAEAPVEDALEEKRLRQDITTLKGENARLLQEVESIREGALTLVGQKVQELLHQEEANHALQEQLWDADQQIQQLRENYQGLEGEAENEKEQLELEVQNLKEYIQEQENKHQEQQLSIRLEIQRQCDQKIEERYEEMQLIQSEQHDQHIMLQQENKQDSTLLQETQWKLTQAREEQRVERHRGLQLQEDLEREKQSLVQQVSKVQNHLSKLEESLKVEQNRNRLLTTKYQSDLDKQVKKNTELQAKIQESQQEVTSLKQSARKMEQDRLLAQKSQKKELNEEVEKIQQQCQQRIESLANQFSQEKAQLKNEIAEFQGEEKGEWEGNQDRRKEEGHRHKSSTVSLMGQMQGIQKTPSEDEEVQERLIRYQDLLDSDHLADRERILCTEIEEVNPTHSSQEGNSFGLFLESKESATQCDLLLPESLESLQARVAQLEREQKKKPPQTEQSINSINERKKNKYIGQLYQTIHEISEYIMKLNKVIQSHEPFDGFIQLEKIQRMYNNSFDLMALMDSQYKIILQGLADKTLAKLSQKNLQVFNQFDIIHIHIGHFRIRNGHAEFQVHLTDDLLLKNWLFYLRYSEVQKFNALLRQQVPPHLLDQVPRFPKKTWFKQNDTEFLHQRQKELNTYMRALLETLAIIDYSSLKDLFQRKIQENMQENVCAEQDVMRNWYALIQQLPQRTRPHLGEEISNEFLRDVLWYVKQEIGILSSKFESIKKDIQMLDQNDTFLLMQYTHRAERPSA